MRYTGFLVLSLACAATAATAATEKSGVIGTETWAKANSPYVLTGSITVPAGATLTVEPGVDVLARGDFSLTASGSIVAIGTESDSIRFLPDTVFGATQWAGIRLIGGDHLFAVARIAGAAADDPDDMHNRNGTIYQEAGNAGGGIFAVGPGTRLHLAGVVIARNSARFGGGIWLSTGVVAEFERCTIARDSAYHYAGGVAVWTGASAEFTDCTIADNVAAATKFLRDVGGLLVDDDGVATLVRCTITGNRAGRAGGIQVNEARVTLTDCVIDSNFAGFAGGVYLDHADVTMERCRITRNGTNNDAGGIFAGWESDLTLRNCTIAGNRAKYKAGGIWIVPSSSATIENTVIWGNVPDGILRRWTDYEPLPVPARWVVAWSDVQPGGIYTAAPSSFSADPLFADTVAFALAPGSPCVDAGRPTFADLDGSRSDMGWTGGGRVADVPGMAIDATQLVTNDRAPAFLRVRNTGGGDLIVTAVDITGPFAVSTTMPMTVPAGEYGEIGIVWLGGVPDGTAIVRGNGADYSAATVELAGASGSGLIGEISGALTSAGSPYIVSGPVYVPAGGTLSIEPGVTVLFAADVPFVVRGTLTAVGTEADSIRFLPDLSTGISEWGGIRILGTDSCTIAYARISGGDADVSIYDDQECGGAVYLGPKGRLALSDVVAVRNAAGYFGGAIYLADSSRATVRRCTISGNTAFYAGAIAAKWGVILLMVDCAVVGNRVWAHSSAIELNHADATISGCIFRENIDDYQVINVIRSHAAITNTVIAANHGVGIVIGRKSPVEIANCTIADNWKSPDLLASVILHPPGPDQSAAVRLRNTIVRGDVRAQINVDTLAAAYSNVMGGWPGDGNIDVDPLFADPAAGDYTLAENSPCIDAGDPVLVDPDGSRSDIGASVSLLAARAARRAYVATAPTAIEPASAPPRFALLQNAPNPFNPSTVIRFSLARPGDARLAIYNLHGQIVRVLHDGVLAAGAHEVAWDGRDALGRPCASGVYLVRLMDGQEAQVHRAVLVR